MHIKDPKLIPEHYKKLIDPEERKRIGIITAEEMSQEVEARLERDLHNQICQLFNQKGIAYRHDRMDKRTRGTVGWPDFTFSVSTDKPAKVDPTGVLRIIIPCVWECKVGNAKLSPAQEEIRRLLETLPNAWHYCIIRSLQEACDELKSLGI